MKIPTTIAILGLSVSLSMAQLPDSPPTEPGSQPSPGEKVRDRIKDRMKNKMLEGLSPENRARFEEARKKALEDPRIAALREKAESSNREFFEAMRAKMNEIDPGLEEIIKENKKQGREGPGGEGGLASLTEPERQRLNAARERAQADPAVQAAAQKRSQAKTPEERQAAGREFAKAVREAILKLDPSMATILDKLPPEGKRGKDKGSKTPGAE